MIKRWSKFNESLSESIKDEISLKIDEVREILTDFEDDHSLHSYQLVLRGEETGSSGLAFQPGYHQFDRWFEFTSSQIQNRIGYLMRQEQQVELCMIANIKLPLSDDGSLTIDSSGIKKFEDILVANSRLTSMGYDVHYDLAASHHQYKPLKFLIYFNI